MAEDAHRTALAVGSLRVGAGAVLLLLPGLAAGRDASGRMLARTIGIRDVVLGAGQVWASGQGEAMRLAWMRAGTASDVADAALSIGSRKKIGVLKGFAAAGLALPFIGAGVMHEVQSRS